MWNFSLMSELQYSPLLSDPVGAWVFGSGKGRWKGHLMDG